MSRKSRIIIVGSGIVGASTAYHLAQLGWKDMLIFCLLYTSPSPRDRQKSRMPSSA